MISGVPEVYADGGQVVIRKLVLRKLHQQRRFAHA